MCLFWQLQDDEDTDDDFERATDSEAEDQQPDQANLLAVRQLISAEPGEDKAEKEKEAALLEQVMLQSAETYGLSAAKAKVKLIQKFPVCIALLIITVPWIGLYCNGTNAHFLHFAAKF